MSDDGAEPTTCPTEPPLVVEVVRSARRRRTTAAEVVGDTLRIHLPAWMTVADEEHWVEEWTRRFRQRRSAAGIDLGQRAQALAREHALPLPDRVEWADMHSRWGSCTPATRSIRVAVTLARFPRWVLDYVLVHELAHLAVADHSPAFWQLVNRYPRAERARGYLMAKAGIADDE